MQDPGGKAKTTLVGITFKGCKVKNLAKALNLASLNRRWTPPFLSSTRSTVDQVIISFGVAAKTKNFPAVGLLLCFNLNPQYSLFSITFISSYCYVNILIIQYKSWCSMLSTNYLYVEYVIIFVIIYGKKIQTAFHICYRITTHLALKISLN